MWVLRTGAMRKGTSYDPDLRHLRSRGRNGGVVWLLWLVPSPLPELCGLPFASVGDAVALPLHVKRDVGPLATKPKDKKGK